MEGMLAPTLKEQITATIEVREVFNITKVGLVAGAMAVSYTHLDHQYIIFGKALYFHFQVGVGHGLVQQQTVI